ncbi:MAG TPA: hypothetical protein VNJ01_13910 [Bacteriovoracaceae bacterium]|nr:hypothetical protein [Bacteriovoracaceae bacterium]
MKTKLVALGLLSLLNVGVSFGECGFMEAPESGKVYVLPRYEADVKYVFNNQTKNSFAQVQWKLDLEGSRACFRLGKERFGSYKVVIPSVQIDKQLFVKIMGSEQEHPLRVFQEANGHWTGMPGIIKVPFELKAEIASAIQSGKKLAEVSGEIYFSRSTIQRKEIGSLECTEREEEAGLMNLFKRFQALKQKLEQRNSREAVNTDEALEEFLEKCVVFENVEASSLVGFNERQRVTSRIVRGKFSFNGNVAGETPEPVPPLASQTASIFEL